MRLSRAAGPAIVVVLCVLGVAVLLEGWLVTVFGWPKSAKSVLYLLLLGLIVTKLSLDRTWRSLTTGADIALLGVAVAMILAGVLGGSSAVLIGQALFVYLRGVIVFYAFRALRPSWSQLRPMVLIAASLALINVVLGLLQFAFGEPVYTALGWQELQWAGENRAQGLLEHPNDLGHLLGFALLGLLAGFLTWKRVSARWWAVFGLTALVLGMAQSRQSTIAVVCGIAVLAWLVRGRLKRAAAALLVVLVAGLAPLVVSPDSRDELAYRIGGLFNALHMSGDKDSRQGKDGEIRILFVKQGTRLWERSPVVGYGVGQFGGIVALKHDPEWNRDPRFQAVLGPDGFFLHGFESTSVDLFWLHLLVEAGLLGVLAYLAWLYLIGSPLVRAARKSGPLPDSPVVLWSAATLVFAIVVAGWSPSLEDPLFPPLMFAVLGLGWVAVRAREAGQA